jgi:hypothetical protein
LSESTYRELLQWQSHLEHRFVALDGSRDIKKGKPFFLMEHGLDEIERGEMLSLVVDHANYELSFQDIEIPFLVFATEIGFSYENSRHENQEDSSNFWPMFDLRIPNWRIKSKNLKFFRTAFSKYLPQKYSNIYLPDGYWFEKFPNISWPVYQAILCKDARQDLIRLMKKISATTNLGEVTSPQELGDILGEEVTRLVEQNESLRLDQFQDQHRLLGEIAYSMVKPENDLQVDFLSNYALERIRESLPLDLTKIVDDIRENISRTVTRRQSTRSNSTNSHKTYQGSSANRLSGEIKVIGNRESGLWILSLEIPRLISFEKLSPGLSAELHNTLLVKGQANGRIAPKSLLYRDSVVKLDAWPEDSGISPFISESFPANVSKAICGDWKMFESPDLLFKVLNSDYAQLQRHFEIQIDQKYLYLRKEQLPENDGKVFKSTDTSLGDSCYAHEFTITEENWEYAVDLVERAQLIKKPNIDVFPIGEPPYIFEKDIRCVYSVGMTASFKFSSDAHSLQVSVSDEETEESNSLFVSRDDVFSFTPMNPGTYWLRLETIEGDADVGSLWSSETIGSLRVDFLTSTELSELSGQRILMLAPVANPTLEQIVSGEVEITYTGPSGIKTNLIMDAIDAEGETYTSLELNDIQLPILSEVVSSQLKKLVLAIGENNFTDVVSLWIRIQIGKAILEEHEFFTSLRNIRWQRSKLESNTLKLIAKGIDLSSFNILASKVNDPVGFRKIDNSIATRSGILEEDFLLLVPTSQEEDWPPKVLEDLSNQDNVSNLGKLDKTTFNMFGDLSSFDSSQTIYGLDACEKRDLNHILLLLQFIYKKTETADSELNDFIRGPFLERASAMLSISLIDPTWSEIENNLRIAVESDDKVKLKRVADQAIDFAFEIQTAKPTEFGWLNLAGTTNLSVQKKVANLNSTTRAIELANRCFKSNRQAVPVPSEFSSYSERQYRAMDLGLMLTINPLAAGQKMASRPIGSGSWDAFWDNRRAISLYCRLIHILNLEMGVEWAWN